MADEYICKQDMLDAFGLSEKTRKYGGDHSGYDTRMLYEIQDTIESLESADVVPYSIATDGTVTITVPKGTYKKINRVLVEEDGTHWGGLYYAD